MRKRALWGSIFSTAAILLVGWEVGSTMHTIPATVSTSQTPLPTSGNTGAAAPTPLAPTSPVQSPPTAQSPASNATQPAPDGNYLGESASTRYGQVQVQVTIASGTITDVTAVHLTDADGRSVQISNRAAPILQQEIISAQSANVQLVSGATYTSEAYLTSVQSALDQAGF